MKDELRRATYSLNVLNELTYELLDKHSSVEIAFKRSSAVQKFMSNWRIDNGPTEQDLLNVLLLIVLSHSRRVISASFSETQLKVLINTACALILAYARPFASPTPRFEETELLLGGSLLRSLCELAAFDVRCVSYAVKFLTEWVVNCACTERQYRVLIMRMFGVPSWFFAATEFPEFAVRSRPELRPTVEKIAGAYINVDQHLKHLRERREPGPNVESVLLWHLARSLTRYGLFEILLRIDEAPNDSQLQDRLTVCERVLELLTCALRQQALRTSLVPLMHTVQLLTRLDGSPRLHQYSRFFIERFRSIFNLDQVISTTELICAGDKRLQKLTRLGTLQRRASAIAQMNTAADAVKFWKRVRDAPLHQLGEKRLLTQLLTEAPKSVLIAITESILPGECLEHLAASCSSTDAYHKALREIIVEHHLSEADWVKRIADSAVVPNEKLLWANALEEQFDKLQEEMPLALPVLDNQFFSFTDLLMTNYDLYQLEAFYEVREDLQLTLWQLRPRRSRTSRLANQLFGDAPDVIVEKLIASKDYTKRANKGRGSASDPISKFEGSSPYAALVESCTVTNAVDDQHVDGELTVNLAALTKDAAQWEKDMDTASEQVIYLCCVAGLAAEYTESPTCKVSDGFPFSFSHPSDFAKAYNVLAVRTCRVYTSSSGCEGKPDVANEPHAKESVRKYNVRFDSTQYASDMRDINAGLLPDNLYSTFNVAIRRRPETNVYSGHLETIKDLLLRTENLESYLAPEFRDPFLGYVEQSAEPKAFSPAELARLDEHLLVSRPGFEYTQSQKIAIAAALQPGLTLIAGPPGTGKTDVAVQIVSLLHELPENQKTLLLARSNHALNDFFSKIAHFGVDPRHLLRLGIGESSLQIQVSSSTHMDRREEFSAEGRVSLIELEKNMALAEIQQLARAFGIPDSVLQDCCGCLKMRDFYLKDRFDWLEKLCMELPDPRGLTPEKLRETYVWQKTAAQHPALMQIVEEALKRWAAQRLSDGPPKIDCSVWRLLYPGGDSCEWSPHREDEVSFRDERERVFALFDALEEFYPFELMRSRHEKNQYMSSVHAKVVAMTSTRAMSTRAQLIASGFEFNTIVIEEAAQLLEIETILSAFLQKDSRNVLKRIILLGDHLQLGPVVQHRVLRDHCHYGRSLFARLMALKYPRVYWLEEQGRMRPELADLWRGWYEQCHPIGDMAHVVEQSRSVNTGFQFNAQWIDTSDRCAELSPCPHHYVNDYEVEWCLSLFSYMRVLNYPAASVTVLTPYSAQRDMCKQRFGTLAAQNPWLGLPQRIATVDEFQGQQSEIVILSMVRTLRTGHIAEERRAIVALSRARRGLYIIGDADVYAESAIGRKYLSTLLQNRPRTLSILLPAELGDKAREVREPAKLFDLVRRVRREQEMAT